MNYKLPKNDSSSFSLKESLDQITDKSYEQASSLPGVFYTDPDWLEVERSELFSKQWICAGRIEEVKYPGDYIAFDLVGEPIVVVHGLDGKIRALSNVCRHRGTVIAKDKGNVKSFLCPYHHWAYDTTGALVYAPSIEDGNGFDKESCRLPELHCQTWTGFIFVSLSDFPPDIEVELSDLKAIVENYHLEQMKLQYLADETWDINWKALVENFMEGYHLSPLHRTTLHTLTPTELCKHFEAGDHYFGYRVGFTSRIQEGRVGHDDLSSEETDSCVMFAVPPGLTVGVGSDYCSFLCIRPMTPNQTAVKMGLIFHGDNWPQQKIDAAVDMFHKTMEEDKVVLKQVQYGFGSKYHQPGPLAPKDFEGTIWDFHQYLRRNIN